MEKLPYHVIDYNTPWAEWLTYCEICYQLKVPNQPNIGRFMSYRRYLKEIGVIK
jgi:hypothetical protein